MTVTAFILFLCAFVVGTRNGIPKKFWPCVIVYGIGCAVLILVWQAQNGWPVLSAEFISTLGAWTTATVLGVMAGVALSRPQSNLR